MMCGWEVKLIAYNFYVAASFSLRIKYCAYILIRHIYYCASCIRGLLRRLKPAAIGSAVTFF